MPEITPESLAASGTEDGHQMAVFCYASIMARTEPLWGLLYAIPNGGHRHVAVAARLKATGVKAGFPDIGFPVARGGYNALFIEMKRPSEKLTGKSKGTLGKKQQPWHNALREQNNFVWVCFGWEDAIGTIDRYMRFKL